AALRDILDHCGENVPYYRRLFEALKLSAADVATPAHLARLPLLTRDAVMQSASLIQSHAGRSAARASSSSGSSGKPVTTYHAPASRLSILAHRARALAWHDVRPWDRQGLLVPQRRSWARRLLSDAGDRLAQRRRNNTFRFDRDECVVTARRFARFHPVLMLGMPTFLNRLLHFSRDEGLDPRQWNVRLVLSNSEVLTPCIDAILSQGFGCPVLNEYGCTELGSLAHRCPAGTLHLNSEHAIVELVDDEGHPVPAGIPGRVVVTTLHNRCMPLIRYVVGDIAVRAAKPCSCGRQPGYPGLDWVEGRLQQAWRDADGRLLAVLPATGAAQARLTTAGFWESQFAQHGPRKVEVRVEPNVRPDGDVMSDVAEAFRDVLGGPVTLVWSNRPIVRLPSGKLSVLDRDTKDG
ncbi:MAG: AMP-binding protein, partial [Phycisphaerae bacterium]